MAAIIHVTEPVKDIAMALVAVVMDVAHLIARIHVPADVSEIAMARVAVQIIINCNR